MFFSKRQRVQLLEMGLFIPAEFLQFLEVLTGSTLFAGTVKTAPVQPEVQGRTGNLEFWQMLKGLQPLTAPVNQ